VKASRECLQDVTVVRPHEQELVRDSVDVSTFDADPWLERVSDLLAEPDPGPTPFLVSDLLVAKAIAAIQGRWKSWKTWVELELAVSIVTGRRAFGRFEIPDPGPVILVLEESGRDALHRRLGALARGNAIVSADLHDLHFAANRRVRLDDLEWQRRILRDVGEIEPRAVFLDPLARMKSPGRNENEQTEIAPLLDYMRQLRDEGGCAVVFVHHTGHEGTHLRGSSDLESFWESKIAVERKEDADEATFASAHREAEASAEHRFRLAWDRETRSLRLRLTEDDKQLEIVAEVATYLDAHPDASANAVADALDRNRQNVLRAVAHLRDEPEAEEVVPE
jgi:RecA-family ATPase